MKKKVIVGFLIVLFSCKPKAVVVVEKVEQEVNEIENYVNEIESFIHHINIKTKDSDSISISELKFIKNAYPLTLNITDKNVIFRNKKIVKVKYKDYLESNFIKVKSFYYNRDNLVCVRIYELLPTVEGEGSIYKRVLYYKKNKLLLDSNESDYKYQNTDFLNFGIAKLKEEYQSKIND